MEETQGAITIVLNTPKDLNFSLLFPKYTPSRLTKVYFLIHQINYYTNKGGYELHHKHHQKFFGFNSEELSEILYVLTTNKLIKVTEFYTKGKQSNIYEMVNPFNIDDNEKHIFNTSSSNCPIFLHRWVTDGYTVRKVSSYIKPSKEKNKKGNLPTSVTIEPDKVIIQPTEEESATVESDEKEILVEGTTLLICNFNQFENDIAGYSQSESLLKNLLPYVNSKSNITINVDGFRFVFLSDDGIYLFYYIERTIAA
jgi:hypothetical protein